MPLTRNLNDVSVVDGKLIREIPSSRLDNIIARGTQRIVTLTKKIEEFSQEINKCQVQIDRATTLKTELEKP